MKTLPIPLLAAAIAIVALAPAVAEAVPAPGASLHARLVEAVREGTGGTLPATASVDAGFGPRETPFGEALALLEANDAAAPRPTAGGPGAPVQDVGYGVRTEDYGCYVATVVTAFRADLEDALVFGERDVLAPSDPLPCGAGYASWVGTGRAAVAPGALDATACIAFEGALGAWAGIPGSCHVFDFTHAEIRGRVGYLTVRACEGAFCFTVQQMFGATNASPAPMRADAAVIAIR